MLSTLIITVAEDEAHKPIEAMLHCKIFVPVLKPVTLELGESELENTPLPKTKLQEPIPEVGELAASVVKLLEAHKV
jgi:hypothetical protein